MRVINHENPRDFLLIPSSTVVLWASSVRGFRWPYTIEHIKSSVLLHDDRIKYTYSWCKLAPIHMHVFNDLVVGHGNRSIPIEFVARHTIYVMESMNEALDIIPVHLVIHNAERIRLMFERYISDEKDH